MAYCHKNRAVLRQTECRARKTSEEVQSIPNGFALHFIWQQPEEGIVLFVRISHQCKGGERVLTTSNVVIPSAHLTTSRFQLVYSIRTWDMQRKDGLLIASNDSLK